MIIVRRATTWPHEEPAMLTGTQSRHSTTLRPHSHAIPSHPITPLPSAQHTSLLHHLHNLSMTCSRITSHRLQVESSISLCCCRPNLLIHPNNHASRQSFVHAFIIDDCLCHRRCLHCSLEWRVRCDEYNLAQQFGVRISGNLVTSGLD
ncbi:hypothetical protein M758_12G160800 [Ceratodon purpureus]|nr:hypothetical protein M758_12G160800 [Ceratodon purpureus]